MDTLASSRKRHYRCRRSGDPGRGTRAVRASRLSATEPRVLLELAGAVMLAFPNWPTRSPSVRPPSGPGPGGWLSRAVSTMAREDDRANAPGNHARRGGALSADHSGRTASGTESGPPMSAGRTEPWPSPDSGTNEASAPRAGIVSMNKGFGSTDRRDVGSASSRGLGWSIARVSMASSVGGSGEIGTSARGACPKRAVRPPGEKWRLWERTPGRR